MTTPAPRQMQPRPQGFLNNFQNSGLRSVDHGYEVATNGKSLKSCCEIRDYYSEHVNWSLSDKEEKKNEQKGKKKKNRHIFASAYVAFPLLQKLYKQKDWVHPPKLFQKAVL